jgi:hypothetical protein
LLGFWCVIFAVIVSCPQGPSLDGTQGRWKDPTTLRSRVEREKAKGHRKILFPAPLIEYPDEISLETAIAETTIVLADVLGKQSRLVDPSTIVTFYRLQVIEIVSEPTSQCCSPRDDDFPDDLPALASDEMYFAGIGGTMVIADVEVTIKEDFELLEPNGRYLLFLSATPSRKFSLGKVGPRGIFSVAGDGHLESTLTRFKLGRELETRFGSSLARLKSGIARRRN